MAGKSQHLTLSTEEDDQLRCFEQGRHFRLKVRLRAQVIRLNAAGWSKRKIAQHTGRTYGTVCQDLKRWHEGGVEGLVDAPATNQRLEQNGRYCACPPEKLTHEMRELVLEKLHEDRTELGPTGRALPVLALDRYSRETVGCFVGTTNKSGAQELWDSLPACYLDAECYTDLWAAYQTVVFGNQHHRHGKGTQHIERFNCTLRQRVSRLVHKTLSFSKKLENHIAAIWLFIHHYNRLLPL